jgi:hypothetical protein
VNRSTESRLRTVERAMCPEIPVQQRVHRLICRSDSESEAQIAALKACGEASDRDLFICRMLVEPGQVRGAERRRFNEPLDREQAAQIGTGA